MKNLFVVVSLSLLLPALPGRAQNDPRPFPAAEPAELQNGELPRLLSRVEPTFPAALATMTIDEDVHVAFVVDSTGRPVRVRAFFSHHDQLEAAAVDTVKQWRFTPGTCGKHPVSTQMVVALHFKSPLARAAN